ncbi:E3 ubiquitin-protein ligase TRIM39-like isoform X2 [Cynoglossus semilaevis]|uniref:Bloodthirsty-related gene family, member 1 n=1 Tax=Cynoglossus semilaevis TaxID=244447 RepID=A0A3P8VP60_CYNSE|nr:E3 ubiquitin-protein ligase TRIM39-like isoform X2 [Cynoglossus semilaevis]
MALPVPFLSDDQFTCSICLEVFDNPVSTPCGHSFCKSCISSYWEGAGGGAKTYQCPMCKESFRKLPDLHINHTLKEITERYKEVTKEVAMMDSTPPPSLHHLQRRSTLTLVQKPGEMPQGIFTELMTRFQQLNPAEPQNPNENKVKGRLARQSQSLDHSLEHTAANSADPALMNVPLCPIHTRGLEYFCRTDNSVICGLCVETTEHSGHCILPAQREWLIKKSQLGIQELEVKNLICARESKVDEIHSCIQQIQAAAEKETQEAVSAFSALISSVERCQTQVLEMIAMNHRAAEHKAQTLLKELQDEISALKGRSDVLSELAVSDDCFHFLKISAALSVPLQSKDWTNVSVSEPNTGQILRSVESVVERFQEEVKKLPEIYHRSMTEQTVSRVIPKTKRVQEYAADVTLDHRTAHPRLVISADGKQVFCGDRQQVVPEYPERFDRVVCVLAHQGFSSGRHYWEVEVGGKTDWDLGIASCSVNRKGKITVSPSHGYWFLSLRDRTEYAFRTEPSTNISVTSRASRIGVYVDCDKGLLSFYNVEARILIYTFTDKFPDTIHPFFSPCTNKSGRNQAPLIICPPTVTE